MGWVYVLIGLGKVEVLGTPPVGGTFPYTFNLLGATEQLDEAAYGVVV